MKLTNKNNRGETIIAVALAISLFVGVAIGSIMLMNKGLAINQRSVEIMHVGNEIAAQADMLRFTNEIYAIDADKDWSINLNNAATDLFTFDDKCPSTGAGGNMPTNWFVMAIDDGTTKEIKPIQGAELSYVNPETYSKVEYSGDISATNKVEAKGLWIEPLKVDNETIDFHIRACWDSPGSEQPVRLDTVVRLYDPVQ